MARNRVVAIPLLAALMLLSTAFRMDAQDVEMKSVSLGNLGSIDLPKHWQENPTQNDQHIFSDSLQSEGVILYRVNDLQSSEMVEWLRNRAHALGIPDYVRGVDGELKEDAGARLGSFVMGTVPLNPAGETSSNQEQAVPKVTSEIDSSSSLVNPQPIPSRYWMVVTYARGGKVYALEGWCDNLPEGTMVLSELHRSWRLPDK